MMARRPVAPLYLLVALAALLPRVIGLGQFVTIDEVVSWMGRSQRFLTGISTGDLAATAQSAHPGVTTMWLGATGILLHGALAARGLIDASDFATRLALMQLPPALVNGAAVVAGFWLLRRLLAPRAAFLAALLWALDPFVVGYNRVLHVDGLMGSFATLSLLCACVYWQRAGGRSQEVGAPPPAPERSAPPASGLLLIASGACAALAVLSKSPGVAIAPTVLVIALWSARRRGRPWGVVLRELLIWGGVAALAALLAWPALWAAPARAAEKLVQGVTEEGGEPHQSGNYFLGRPTPVPGPLIYPVSLALRLTPWTMLGLGLLGLLWRRTRPGQREALAAMALFALIFTAELSAFPKQFDRYLLPIFPALDVLAAAGLLAAVDRLRSPQARAALLSGLALVAIGNVAWWHPYNLIAFNQLLGGARTGEWALRMGWGEGLQDVAAWLDRQPNIGEVVTVSTAVSSLRPYVRPGVGVELPLGGGRLPDKAGYVVIYLRSQQDGQLEPPFDAFAARQRPVFTLRIKDVDYARVYEVLPTPQSAVRARFGQDIALQGYDLADEGGGLRLTLHWETIGTPPDLSLFAHLLDADGQRQAQIDLPVVTAAWEGGRHYRTQVDIPLPNDLPKGGYQLVIGLYDPASFARLPLTEGPAANPAFAGPDALLVTTLQR
jgi:4-amino-4-deoxy-L-arabinose transferase-like glycosyltransferase